MLRPRVWCEEMVHPEYGTAKVWLAWTRESEVRVTWVVRPIAVEFDLFTPDSEQRKLMAGMKMKGQGTNGGP